MATGMTGPWGPTSQMLRRAGDPLLWHKARRKAMLEEAHRIRGIMVKSFNKGGPPGGRWKRLSAMTQLVSRARGKGDRRPLLDSGSLRNSHSVVVVDDDTVFVGVHRTAKASKRARGKGNVTPVDIASIHEHGSKQIYINASQGSAKGRRVRGFFIWLHRKSKGQVMPLRANTVGIVVRIPPRPWVAPIWEQEKDQITQNVVNNTIKHMGVPMITRALR